MSDEKTTSLLRRYVRGSLAARAAWRLTWHRYQWVRNRVRAVRSGIAIAGDADSAALYERGEGKPYWRRVADHTLWAVRHGSPNPFYYMFGMDAATGTDYDKFMSVREMLNIITRQIEADGTEHAAAVLKDKFFFSLVAQALGWPAPRTIAVLEPSRLTLLHPRSSVSYATFIEQAEAVDGFVKPVGGQKGTGAFALRVSGGEALIDGEPARPDEVAALISGRFLLQERIVQHSDLAALHSSSVNTVRLVTVLRDGRAEPLAAILRIGAGGSPVDNWSGGGLIVELDLETGALRGRGVFKSGYGGDELYGGYVDEHPDSGIQLDGYPLPMIPDAVRLARQVHVDMGGPRTVGWDLAFTPNGPVIVEGNSHWGATMYMTLDPQFKDRYFAAAGIDERERALLFQRAVDVAPWQ